MQGTGTCIVLIISIPPGESPDQGCVRITYPVSGVVSAMGYL